MLSRLLALALAAFPALAFAQSAVLNGFPPGVFQSRAAIDGGGAPAGPTYSFKGSDSNGMGSGLTETFSVNIGTAASDRLVVVFFGVQNAIVVSNISVAGVNLTQSTQINGGSSGGTATMWYGLVTSGSGSQSIVVTGSTSFSFQNLGANVWTLNGLSSNIPVTSSSGGTNLTISATAGQIMLAGSYNGLAGGDFSSSTQVPTAVHVSAGYNQVYGADWASITSTNASFVVFPLVGSTSATVAATFH